MMSKVAFFMPSYLISTYTMRMLSVSFVSDLSVRLSLVFDLMSFLYHMCLYGLSCDSLV
jgi:hypothetical protein